MFKFISLLSSILLLSGCSQTIIHQSNNQPTAIETAAPQQIDLLIHAYQYQLLNSEFQPTTLTQLVETLNESDVIFIGEFHGNHASHLLQMELFSGLYQQNNQLILSMEMFNRDQQAVLNSYLDDEIGESYLTQTAPAWKNYTASYRPQVEFAKEHFLPVIAANASADIVRCIGQQGEAYFDKLTVQERTNIAEKPFAQIPGYQDKFFAFIDKARKLSEQRKQQSYLAQITRDNTMAESILQATLNNPGYQVIHLNGTFHSDNHLGTVSALKRMAPKLKVSVITPIYIDEFNEVKLQKNRLDDFYYLLRPQPVEFVNSENRRKAHKKMFEKARNKAQKCK